MVQSYHWAKQHVPFQRLQECPFDLVLRLGRELLRPRERVIDRRFLDGGEGPLILKVLRVEGQGALEINGCVGILVSAMFE